MSERKDYSDMVGRLLLSSPEAKEIERGFDCQADPPVYWKVYRECGTGKLSYKVRCLCGADYDIPPEIDPGTDVDFWCEFCDWGTKLRLKDVDLLGMTKSERRRSGR